MGGVLKNLDIKNDCFCQGTKHYGPYCSIHCNNYFHFHPDVPEVCLSEDCDVDAYISCLDAGLKPRFNITYSEIKKDFYPLCEPVAEICRSSENVFFVDRHIQETPHQCQNNGTLRKLNHTSTCHCLGTHFYGDLCEKSCDEFGYEIPESCLSNEGPCDLPKECVDLSRPGVHINRCKNGLFLIGKKGGQCSCAASGFFGKWCERECPSVRPTCGDNCADLYSTDCIF